ncbi:archaeal proteasome endopeptidase complex subunit alpha [Candidatus Bathyarchaeota archaeon]|nr:archaeal proteasome endopeptidase complex subunit alpha [Candidatus Bathyarchaeota archaeon]NIU80951.1 archaeal proteasome endopeptidase complex subunit alpha [Candidatus Bathyarchaeota archaeon]
MSAFRRKKAYDRIATRFSPEGRLFQVEYAFETAKRGATIIGLVCSEGVVLGAEEPLEGELQDPEQSWKIYKVDDHVGAAVAGMWPDARVLIDKARVHAQSNRLMYEEPIGVQALTKHIGDIKQPCTQHIWVRPFGASLILGGVDKTGNKVFKTHPSGSYRSYRAVAEGVGKGLVEDILNEEYRNDMSLDDAIKLTIRCLMEDLKARNEEARIRITVIPAETRRLSVLSELEVGKYKKAVEEIGEK